MRIKNLLKLLIGLAIVTCLYFNPFKIVMVVGNSMYPTLKSHQLVLAKKVSKIERGDIIIAYNDFREIIVKRVIYMPGESYKQVIEPSFTEPKLVEDLTETDLMVFLLDNRSFAFDCVVPKNQYFVMGDNRKNSDDSRRFGTLERKDIIYKVVYK